MPKIKELLANIVASGACIGCGLCAGVSASVNMVRTAEGRERPRGAPSAEEATLIAHACPGLVVEGLGAEEASGARDLMWGDIDEAFIGWAADPKVRFEASTGGALSALAKHLLDTGAADFLLDVAPDPAAPARSVWRISEVWSDAGGSRYGPAAPLAGLVAARARGGRFVFIGKPCDVSAIRRLAKVEDWLRDALVCTLTLICGGASEFSKTADLLAGWGVAEGELENLRYRGNGNPGPTVAVTTAGTVRETTYQALWEDEGTWAIQHRCKICPDAIGMASDIVAFDVWPGANPLGEDEGFNGVISRTAKGTAILNAAVAAGALARDRKITAADMEDVQPHQSAKRRAVWARLAGQRAAGAVAPAPLGLGVEEIARQQPLAALLAEAKGSRDRLKAGRGREVGP